MTLDAVDPSVIGLLPVVTFLAVLLYFDSYKLVRLRMVLGIVACGAVIAVVGYAINAAVIAMLGVDVVTFSRYVAPVIEEFLKAAVVVALIRTHRIGFPVDAAICGFAAGLGGREHPVPRAAALCGVPVRRDGAGRLDRARVRRRCGDAGTHQFRPPLRFTGGSIPYEAQEPLPRTGRRRFAVLPACL